MQSEAKGKCIMPVNLPPSAPSIWHAEEYNTMSKPESVQWQTWTCEVDGRRILCLNHFYMAPNLQCRRTRELLTPILQCSPRIPMWQSKDPTLILFGKRETDVGPIFVIESQHGLIKPERNIKSTPPPETRPSKILLVISKKVLWKLDYKIYSLSPSIYFICMLSLNQINTCKILRRYKKCHKSTALHWQWFTADKQAQVPQHSNRGQLVEHGDRLSWDDERRLPLLVNAWKSRMIVTCPASSKAAHSGAFRSTMAYGPHTRRLSHATASLPRFNFLCTDGVPWYNWGRVATGDQFGGWLCISEHQRGSGNCFWIFWIVLSWRDTLWGQ